MSTLVQAAPLRQETQMPCWSLTTRTVFRFCFVYLGLYCLASQIFSNMIPIPNRFEPPDLQTLWPIRPIILWVAAHILHITRPLVYTDTGSGDRTFDWIVLLLIVIVAALATTIWSALDRKRENYITLYKWFRVFIRISLASEMILYGMAKVIPVQMPYPSLARLLQPFGTFSPMGALWSFMGASPAYEIFTGCAELLGGILLIFPRAAMLGALVCLADTTQVVALNMTYDVCVKLTSFHLLFLALFLLAPELSRMVNFFLWNRPVGASMQPQLFAMRRANRIALAAQIILGIWIVAGNAYNVRSLWRLYSDGQPKSPLYGIWNVQELSIDGQVRAPLLTDKDRWRRVIFDAPGRMVFQLMDDSFAGYGGSINVNDKTLALSMDNDKNWKASFRFQRPAQDQLAVDGSMDGHQIHMQLQLLDLNKFLLLHRGFHWIQETPYSR